MKKIWPFVPVYKFDFPEEKIQIQVNFLKANWAFNLILQK
jgi:hypothetical protein